MRERIAPAGGVKPSGLHPVMNLILVERSAFYLVMNAILVERSASHLVMNAILVEWSTMGRQSTALRRLCLLYAVDSAEVAVYCDRWKIIDKR
jgi:hypothetical protein